MKWCTTHPLKSRDNEGVWIAFPPPASMFFFLSFFFFFFFERWEARFDKKVVYQWVSYTVHGTHKPLYSTTFSLKIGHAVLFTHLKNYFATVFFVFSFQQNKQYLNRPNFSKSDMSKKKKKMKAFNTCVFGLVGGKEKKKNKGYRRGCAFHREIYVTFLPMIIGYTEASGNF